jgi:hypothetical protein
VNPTGLSRGDGVGIEVTRDLLRGIRLGAHEPGRVVAAAEVPVVSRSDDRAVLDALVRLRAELGNPQVPTRVAMFPPGSTLSRVDATGLAAGELNASRARLAGARGATSSVLVDDGPRRWLMGVAWDDAHIRRVEELAERAGFIDVAVDPSPVALVRVLDGRITHLRRDAAPDQSFAAVASNGLVVAGAAFGSIGHNVPNLSCNQAPVSPGWFDDIVDQGDLVIEIRRLLDEAPSVDCTLRLAGMAYPDFPAHDLRAPERQCVALGAAVGAAGLAGRLRPVDMLVPVVSTPDDLERPWAIERVADLPTPRTAKVGRAKRMVARMLPRRR